MFFPPSAVNTEGERRLEEIARQHDIIAAELWPRNFVTAVTFVICGLIINPVAAALLLVVNVISDVTGTRLMDGLDPATHRGRYFAVFVAVITMEASLMTVAGLVWLEDDPLAKALAVGIAMATLLHLSSIRSIHLALGVTGVATVGLVAFVFNLIFWIGMKDWSGLAVTTITAMAGLSYAMMAMVSNHNLHRASAAATAAARASDAAKGRFLAQISHELRTPLNAVIGLGEIAAATATGASLQRLRTVVTSARDLAVMLDDAIDFSALADGRLSVSPRPASVRTDLSALVPMFDLITTGGSKYLVRSVSTSVVSPTRIVSPDEAQRGLAEAEAEASFARLGGEP